MLEKCAGCGSRILAGGEMFLDQRFCGEACAGQFRSEMVEKLVPPEVIEQHVQQLFEAPCPLCGKTAGNNLYSATKISAFLVFFQVQTQSQVCCASCGRKHRLKAALHCLFAGWWGPKAAFCNVFVLPTNLLAAAFIRRPQEPSHALRSLAKTSMADALAPQILASMKEAPAGIDPDL